MSCTRAESTDHSLYSYQSALRDTPLCHREQRGQPGETLAICTRNGIRSRPACACSPHGCPLSRNKGRQTTRVGQKRHALLSVADQHGAHKNNAATRHARRYRLFPLLSPCIHSFCSLFLSQPDGGSLLARPADSPHSGLSLREIAMFAGVGRTYIQQKVSLREDVIAILLSIKARKRDCQCICPPEQSYFFFLSREGRSG